MDCPLAACIRGNLLAPSGLTGDDIALAIIESADRHLERRP